MVCILWSIYTGPQFSPSNFEASDSAAAVAARSHLSSALRPLEWVVGWLAGIEIKAHTETLVQPFAWSIVLRILCSFMGRFVVCCSTRTSSATIKLLLFVVRLRRRRLWPFLCSVLRCYYDDDVLRLLLFFDLDQGSFCHNNELPLSTHPRGGRSFLMGGMGRQHIAENARVVIEEEGEHSIYSL